MTHRRAASYQRRATRDTPPPPSGPRHPPTHPARLSRHATSTHELHTMAERGAQGITRQIRSSAYTRVKASRNERFETTARWAAHRKPGREGETEGASKAGVKGRNGFHFPSPTSSKLITNDVMTSTCMQVTYISHNELHTRMEETRGGEATTQPDHTAGRNVNVRAGSRRLFSLSTIPTTHPNVLTCK